MKNYSVSDSWTIQDMMDIEDTLTQEQCVEILQNGEAYYSAEIGYNWDFWTGIVDDYLDESEEGLL
jgi:hypothetical protein